jgi:hypothetical protein
MNHAQVDLREPTELHVVDSCLERQDASDITDNTIAKGMSVDGEAEFESLTIDQTATILGASVEKVKLLMENNILCRGESFNGQPSLIAACVRAQAGKSRADFMREVKKLISGENNKRLRVPSPAPLTGEMTVQELFDDIAAVDLNDSARMIAALKAKIALPSISNEDPAGSSIDGEKELVVPGINREQITIRNLNSLLENLDFTNVRLEGAMYRVGFLEAKIATLEEQLEEVPELRAKFARSLILERENADFQKEIAQYKLAHVDHQREIAKYQAESAEYLKTIAKHETELLEMHSLLDRIRNSWWCRLWCWMTGNELSK